MISKENAGAKSTSQPDWQDPSAYADKLSEQEWAWEFLRRNDQYEQDFLKWQSISVRVRNADGADLRENLEVWHVDHPAIENEKYAEWLSRFPGERPVPLLRYLQSKWHLSSAEEINELPNPSEPWDENRFPSLFDSKLMDHIEFRSFDLTRAEAVARARPVTVKWQLREGQAAVLLDATRSLEEQKKFVTEILSQVRAFTEKHHPESMIARPKRQAEALKRYLRILDGLRCGANLKRIWTIIECSNGEEPSFDHMRTARRQKKQAEKLRDSEYVELLKQKFD